MADQNAPNDASRKSKAEGDREPDRHDTDRQGAGISNRPLEEERESQAAVDDREGGPRRSER